MTVKGHCLCKATSWEYQGEVSWSGYCHCDDCRRNCSAPVVAWIGVPHENFSWTGEVPNTYESSKGVTRHFCQQCGSPMGFEAEHYPKDMHIYAASLEDPNLFKPSFHVNIESKLHWICIDDDLKKYEGTLLETPTD